MSDGTLDEDLLCSPSEPDALSDADRVRFITAEVSEGFRILSKIGKAVSFFGSVHASVGDPSYELARSIAYELGSAGFAIITGAGPGIMAAANQGARESGVASIGLNIELPIPQAVNQHVDLVLSFRHFFARKLMFVRYASAFVFLPGGFGTLDELFEALTLTQTNKIRHFPIVLAGNSHWEGLMDWLSGEVLTHNRVRPEDLALVTRSDDPREICEVIQRAHLRSRAATPLAPTS